MISWLWGGGILLCACMAIGLVFLAMASPSTRQFEHLMHWSWVWFAALLLWVLLGAYLFPGRA